MRQKTNQVFAMLLLWSVISLLTGCGGGGSGETAPGDTNTQNNSSVASPSFSPAGGNYTGPQTVSIATATSGASIYYTTDGSTPSNNNDTLYTVPIVISSTTTLKAAAFKTGIAGSPISSATYSISPVGTPMNVTLAQGSNWEFFWTSKKTSTAQGSGTSVDTTAGGFTVTLGAPVTLDGRTAYPIAVTGNSSDGTVDFAPEWTHMAAEGGSLYCSTNGTTLAPCFDATKANWSGAGFFVSFGSDVVKPSSGTFQGAYNTLPSTVLSRETSAGGCTYYSSIGENVCSDSSYSISEKEFYKSEIGPIGYYFYSSYSSSGGGFYTATKYERTVELVASSLAATDGTAFNRPPWKEVAKLNTPRYGHSSVVLAGKIYTLGGSRSTMEVYDPGSNVWTSLGTLPTSFNPCFAEAIGGKIYTMGGSGSLYIYDPALNAWTVATGPGVTPETSTAIQDRYLMVFYTEWFSIYSATGIKVKFYDTQTGSWATGYNNTYGMYHQDFCASTSGQNVYLTGGNRQTNPLYGSTSPSDKIFDSTFVYAYVGGGWSSISGPFATYNCACSTLNGDIVALGGNDGSGDLRKAKRFSVSSNSWTALADMLTPRKEFDAVELDGKLYIIGGKTGSTALDTVYVYTP